MKRILPTFATIKLSALLLAIATPSVALAESYAYADCSLQSNLCYGEGGSDSGPVTLMWSFESNGIDAIFPRDCTNQNDCSFWCPRYPGPLIARLYVYDANFNVLAISDPAPGLCTQQDIVLP